MKTLEYIAAVIVVFGTLLSAESALADNVESIEPVITAGESS